MADFAITQDDIKALSDDQQSVIFDALVTAAWADGNVSEAEMSRFEKEIVKIPWGKPDSVLIEMVKASKERLASLKTRDSVLTFIKDIADKLPKQELREKVVYTMGLIMFTDRELNNAEANVITAFKEAFGIDKERFDALASAVREN
jgi:uncharacterized tellurite resistance protein B-like protein